jgi:hypothetical protein
VRVRRADYGSTKKQVNCNVSKQHRRVGAQVESLQRGE